MRTTILFSGLFSTLVVALPATEYNDTVSQVLDRRQAGKCAPVHIIVARASTEPAGEGMIGSLSRSIKTSIPGATSEAVSYPAALAPYGPSEIKGVAAAKAQLTAYVQKCPQSKMVLMGYSQGADVVGSVVCGGGGFSGSMQGAKVELGPITPPIDPQVGSHIVAVVMMGDPRFTKGMSFNKGTAKNNGQFPHPPENTCKGYESRMVSYCNDGDTFCDKGKSVATHMGYMGAYSGQAKTFITTQVKSLTIPLAPAPDAPAPAAAASEPGEQTSAEPAAAKAPKSKGKAGAKGKGKGSAPPKRVEALPNEDGESAPAGAKSFRSR